ncbi:sodium:calcium antiporter [Haloplanus halobius]|uniref:sodium:calcium antiporter n=1 Tax=Haloplanus halobius TaxID=2934938 RepID=UPI00200ED922|nr:sodium:calcium antiporter [Haloplanus sp. XH21]
MFVEILFLLAGLAALVYGGELVVGGASGLAHGFGLPKLFVGVTVVAIGSSVPEIATSIYAGAYQAPQFAVGHIVGSATAQITVGVGVVALLSPLTLDRSKVRLYGGGMLVAMALMLATVWSGEATRVEGAALATIYLLFLALRYEDLDFHDAVDTRATESTWRSVASLGLGLALVVIGGHFLVVNSRNVALAAGVPHLVVGLLTGLGTTLPEIAIAAIAVSKDRSGIAIGTLLGSNITDPLFSFGVGAAVGGFTFADVGAVLGAGGYMLLASTVVVAVLFVRGRVSRLGAIGCISLYAPTFLV